MTAVSIGSLARIAFGASLLFFLGFAAPAMAQNCENDMGVFQEKRNAQMEDIGKLQKKNEGKLDPVAACPMLRSLASLEKTMLVYMEKNQNWCNIPDQIISNVKEGSGKTAAVARQACNIALRIKRGQDQPAAGPRDGGPGFNVPAPKLPAGPL